jgi:hypothetical protein
MRMTLMPACTLHMRFSLMTGRLPAGAEEFLYQETIFQRGEAASESMRSGQKMDEAAG